MSKYVKKKHGLTIGSDNIFFVAGDGEMRDGYRSIVTAERYYFDQINTVNVFIETPANQIIWTNIGDERTYEELDGESRKPYVISNHCKRWLETNIGEYQIEWDTYSRCAGCDRTVFFKRRTDALKFIKHINDMLEGMRFGL